MDIDTETDVCDGMTHLETTIITISPLPKARSGSLASSWPDSGCITYRVSEVDLSNGPVWVLRLILFASR
jgi:hypothetical protein